MNRSLWHAALVLWTAASLVVAPLYAQAQQPQAPPQSQSSLPSQPQAQLPQNPPENQTSQPSTAVGPVTPKTLQIRSDYWKGKSWFPDFIAPYSPRSVEQPSLANTPKIDQLIQDGKLNLSLDDAVSLALENNLDIRVQRYTAWVIDTQLLKAQAGGVPQPASAQQVVLGTPPSVSFDPVLSAQANLATAFIPVNNIFTSGVGTTAVPVLDYHTDNFNFGYAQGFHTGTAVQIQWTNQRQSTNSPGVFFNPDVYSTLTVQVTQPLLNGCCFLPNTRYIIEAKNSTKIAAAQFAQAVIADITTTSDDYWELVYDRQYVKVEEQAVSVSQKLYEDNKKQLEIGTLAPLDVVTAESQLAQDKQNLVAAQTAKLLQETKLLNDITKDPLAPKLAGVEIVPTTPVETPEIVENVPLNDLMSEAWKNRPEMTQALLTLENDKVEVKATRNSLLPSLTLFGYYQGQAYAGNQTITTSETVTGFQADLEAPVVNASGVPIVSPTPLYSAIPIINSTTVVNRTGIGTALRGMINASTPSYEGGINLSLPLRNRSAQADNARAQLGEREQEVTLQELKNTIFVNVRQAQVALQQYRAQVAAATEARKLAQQTLDAQEKKYQLGSSDSYTVVLRARDLTSAEGVELRAEVNLVEAQVAFNQAMGRTLNANKITLADAFRGSVSRTPNIPGSLDADDPPHAPNDSWAPGKK